MDKEWLDMMYELLNEAKESLDREPSKNLAAVQMFDRVVCALSVYFVSHTP